MASVDVAFPAAVACALLVAAAVFLVGSASASWHARVFEVGGEPRGWAKPAALNGETYNHWAARNRFHVGDFLRKYSCNASITSCACKQGVGAVVLGASLLVLGA